MFGSDPEPDKFVDLNVYYDNQYTLQPTNYVPKCSLHVSFVLKYKT